MTLMRGAGKAGTPSHPESVDVVFCLVSLLPFFCMAAVNAVLLRGSTVQNHERCGANLHSPLIGTLTTKTACFDYGSG